MLQILLQLVAPLLTKLDHLVELLCEYKLDGCQLLLNFGLGVDLNWTRWALWSCLQVEAVQDASSRCVRSSGSQPSWTPV